MVQSVGTVAILGGLGAVADFLVFVVLVVAGKWVGISGGSHEITALGSKLKTPSMPWAAFRCLSCSRSRVSTPWPLQPCSGGGSASRLYRLWRMLVELACSPIRLATLLTASAATTLLLASGFAVSALAASPAPSVGFGSLFIGS